MTDKKKNIDYKKIAKALSKNYWTISTLVLAVLLIAVLISGGITGAAISADAAGQKVLAFANNQYPNAEILEVTDEGGLYEVILSIDGQESPLYATKDGKSIVLPQGIIPLEVQTPDRPTTDNTPKIPIHECIKQYDISDETIIFYYSDQCGWCAKMKPGVENLEKEGYSFKWIEGSNAEDSQLIDDCIRPHMTGGGVPQFICPKTSEIHVGAFADENKNLDQLALKNWVDNCIAN